MRVHYALGLLITYGLLTGCAASTGTPETRPPIFTVTAEGEGNEMTASAQGDTSVFDVYSRSGIGSGMVEFMETEQAWVPMEHHEYSETSTIGNPFRGTKEKGLKYFERSAEHLAAFLKEVKKFPVQATNREFNNRA